MYDKQRVKRTQMPDSLKTEMPEDKCESELQTNDVIDEKNGGYL